MFRRRNVIKEAAATSAMDRRNLLKTGMFAGLGLAAAPALAACGGGSAGSGPALKWAGWDGPPQSEVFRRFSEKMTEELGVKVTYQQVVGDYLSKLLPQLSAGAAPDAFYVGDVYMAKLIETKQVLDLTDYLDSGDAAVKLDDFHEGLYRWCRPADGSPGLFGLPVDCNPMVFWFNKDLLAEAGVSTDPAAQFEAGTWTQDALTDMLDKIRATKKRGLVLNGSNWLDWFGWMSTFGGTLFDESGKAVFDTDPKSQEALAWLFEQLKSGNITYSGALPQGQLGDVLFYAGQLVCLTYARVVLPNVKKVEFGFDIAPLPSLSGKDVMPVPVNTAALSVNAKSKNQAKALEFLGNFLNAEGQRFRLSGGGNAVPSVKGLDDIVTEGNVPAHGSLFNDVAAKGYAVPSAIAGNAKVAQELPVLVDKMLKAGNETPRSFSGKVVKLINGGS
ncbi:ABC transporter substrate-binding protein [Streptomyces coeruleorubidus]|uniref:ABC transporter substrate-binding protein n=1 Tax=Streptomyces coeruleorubidus TaxID=116188 RepID=UPI0036B1BBC0